MDLSLVINMHLGFTHNPNMCHFMGISYSNPIISFLDCNKSISHSFYIPGNQLFRDETDWSRITQQWRNHTPTFLTTTCVNLRTNGYTKKCFKVLTSMLEWWVTKIYLFNLVLLPPINITNRVPCKILICFKFASNNLGFGTFLL